MLVRLQSGPDDADLRRRAAEARGKPDDAAMVLAPLVNLTGHDADTGLPCLCRTCLPAAGRAAEANGMQFVRSFAVTGTRVLHVWQQLADQPTLRRLDVRRTKENDVAGMPVVRGGLEM